MVYIAKDETKNVLVHHGIVGMHWGIRRYQNEDGSLTSAGRKRYNEDTKWAGNEIKTMNQREKEAVKNYGDAARYQKQMEKYAKKANKYYEKGNEKKNAKYLEKTLKARDLRDLSEKKIKDLDSKNWKSVADLASKGFDVKISNKDFKYISGKGKALALGFGLIGSAAASNSGDMAVISGKKYSAGWSKNSGMGTVNIEADAERLRLNR